MTFGRHSSSGSLLRGTAAAAGPCAAAAAGLCAALDELIALDPSLVFNLGYSPFLEGNRGAWASVGVAQEP